MKAKSKAANDADWFDAIGVWKDDQLEFLGKHRVTRIPGNYMIFKFDFEKIYFVVITK